MTSWILNFKRVGVVVVAIDEPVAAPNACCCCCICSCRNSFFCAIAGAQKSCIFGGHAASSLNKNGLCLGQRTSVSE